MPGSRQYWYGSAEAEAEVEARFSAPRERTLPARLSCWATC